MARITETLSDGTVVTMYKDGTAVCLAMQSPSLETLTRISLAIQREYYASFFHPVCVDRLWSTFGKITTRQ